MKKVKGISLFLSVILLGACVNDPKVNPNIPGGTEGDAGEAKINCVEKGGLLVSKKGGGWWCKLNGQLRPLSDF